jgi:outer membrane protein assembly factor BamB
MIHLWPVARAGTARRPGPAHGRPDRLGAALASAALLLAAACSSPAPESTPPPLSGRPMYQVDAQHTGRSPYGGPTSLILYRTFNVANIDLRDPVFASADFQSSAAVAPDGTAYIGMHSGTLFALRDPVGGGNQLTAPWSFHPPGGSSWHATPAIGRDGTVYVGFSTNSSTPDAEGALYALQAPDRGIEPRVAWSVDLGPGRQTSSPTIGPDGTIYAVSGSGRLSAITPDGAVRWTAQTGPVLKSSPALGYDGTVYVPSMNGKLYAVAPPRGYGVTSGSVRWTFRFNDYPGSGPAVTAWVPPAGADGIGSGASPTIGPDGTIYVGANNSNLYALSPDGQLLWMFEAIREVAGIWTTPALSADGRTLYFGANRGGIYAVDSETGSMQWRFNIEGSVYSSVALGANGVLYTGSTVGHVFALDAATGRMLADYDAGNAVWTAPAIRPDGTLLVADRKGRVMVLGNG